MLKLVDEPVKVVTHSYAAWLGFISFLLFLADHMEWLDMVPEQYRTIVQTVLLALIPVARIIKQKSLQPSPVATKE